MKSNNLSSANGDASSGIVSSGPGLNAGFGPGKFTPFNFNLSAVCCNKIPFKVVCSD